MEKSCLLSPSCLHYLIFFVRRSLRSRLKKGQILVHGTHDIASLVLCFFGSNLFSRWQQRDWMEERGEFPTRFIIARRSRPTTTRTIGPPSSHWAPCEASVAQAAKSEGKGVYSFTCTFIFHGERKHEKKGLKKGS